MEGGVGCIGTGTGTGTGIGGSFFFLLSFLVGSTKGMRQTGYQ